MGDKEDTTEDDSSSSTSTSSSSESEDHQALFVPACDELMDMFRNNKISLTRPITLFNLYISYWKATVGDAFHYRELLDAYSKLTSEVKQTWKQRAAEMNRQLRVSGGKKAVRTHPVFDANPISNPSNTGIITPLLKSSDDTLSSLLSVATHFQLMADTITDTAENLRSLVQLGVDMTSDNQAAETVLNCVYIGLSVLANLTSTVYGSRPVPDDLLENLAFAMPGISADDN